MMKNLVSSKLYRYFLITIACIFAVIGFLSMGLFFNGTIVLTNDVSTQFDELIIDDSLDIVETITHGYIRPQDPIIIHFSSKRNYDETEPAKGYSLTLSRSIMGDLSWLNSSTLIFKPKINLEINKEYNGTFVFPEGAIQFNIHTYPQSVEKSESKFIPLDKEKQDFYTIQTELRFYLPTDENVIHDCFSIKSNYKSLSFQISKRDDTHFLITSEPVERKSALKTIHLSLSKKIGLKKTLINIISF